MQTPFLHSNPHATRTRKWTPHDVPPLCQIRLKDAENYGFGLKDEGSLEGIPDRPELIDFSGSYLVPVEGIEPTPRLLRTGF